ncbi:MAG: hypothetical protein ACKVZJ_10955 [Phycisphaerales bacterium]
MKNRSVSRLLGALPALSAVVFCGAAFAGTIGEPQYDVSLRTSIERSVLNTNAPAYLTFPQLTVSGFTDPKSPANFAEVSSSNRNFIGQVNGEFSSSSLNYADLQGMLAEYVAGNWTLTITDGVTRSTTTYTFGVQVNGITDDFLSPLTITNYAPGSTIPSSPEFAWSIGDASSYDSQFYYYSGEGAFAFGNQLGTQWAPGTLEEGTYQFGTSYTNNNPSSELFIPSTPTPVQPPLGRGTGLASFSSSLQFQTRADVTGLVVVPTPGVGAAALLACGVLGSRRRRA